MPVIGKLHVAGMTVEELRDKLTEIAHREAASDALVQVELINFTVVVAGEVNSPRIVYISKTDIRFSKPLGPPATSPLTVNVRECFLYARKTAKIYKRLDLNSSDILNSPYFYLRQNDYIYVEPNNIREENAKYNQNNSYKLTVISTIVSAASVIASLVIALTIK